MGKEKKDRKPDPRVPLISLAAAAAFLVLVLVLKDPIVIVRGIRAYRSTRTACAVFVAVSAASVAVASARLMAYKKKMALERPDIPDAPDKKSFTEADRKAMYQELMGFSVGKWSSMPELHELRSQLDSMDEYQEELGRLLEQTEYLKEKPAEIVQRVEDCMYVNIKKLLNYMRIIQTKSRSTMASKIHECVQKNADLLSKTDDFVVAVVGYVNGDMAPGEEEKTKDYVDSYMFVVLDAIELPETYLR